MRRCGEVPIPCLMCSSRDGSAGSGGGASRCNDRGGSSSHLKFCEENLSREVQDGDSLLAGHAGEAFEKIVEGLAAFEVIKEVLDRDARTGEARSTAEQIG